MPCLCCGVEGPTKYVQFYQNIGLVVTRLWAKVEGELCRPCIGRYFRSYTLTTLFLGWWGVISLFMAAYAIFNNVVQFIGASSLPEPGIGALDRPVGLNPPPVDSGSFTLKIVYGVIVCAAILGAIAYHHVEFMEKVAPGINAKLHNGELSDDADGEYAGVQIGKDIAALEADIKSKDWTGFRAEVLARESYLTDLNLQNNKFQDRLVVERNANLGANDVCENLGLTEWGPSLKEYTASQNDLFAFAKSTSDLTDEKAASLHVLTDKEAAAMKHMRQYFDDNDKNHCDK